MTIRGMLLFAAITAWQPALAESEWIPLFNGTSLAQWKETPFPGRGKVTVKDGMVLFGKGRMTGITFTGEFPRTNYEIRFEAARLDGNDFFGSIVFPVKDAFCSWINGGWDGAVVGLSNIDDYDASENDTSTVKDFERGRWYAFRLMVSDDRITAWIDGHIVIDTALANRKVSLRFDDTDLSTPLGFASYATAAGLRNIEYRRVTR